MGRILQIKRRVLAARVKFKVGDEVSVILWNTIHGRGRIVENVPFVNAGTNWLIKMEDGKIQEINECWMKKVSKLEKVLK
jgi:hypothetical protein